MLESVRSNKNIMNMIGKACLYYLVISRDLIFSSITQLFEMRNRGSIMLMLLKSAKYKINVPQKKTYVGVIFFI